MARLIDVFTMDEIAQAAGVPCEAIQQLVDSGELRAVSGTRLFRAVDAVRAGRAARIAARDGSTGAAPLSFALPSSQQTERRMSVLASSAAHASILAALVWSTSNVAQMAATDPPKPRLIFLMGPGPGGGGGGGGSAPRVPEPRIAKPRPTASEAPAPEPQTPLPSRVPISPVASSAGDAVHTAPVSDGTGGGEGPGLGDGTGGGAGGGPYRPGSGVDPPRLLREVKAQYTEEARTRNIRGAVILEIVVTADGTVGDVTVLRGLGYGLDERAATAVRGWRFAPATRFGQAVDVIVEVEVAFSLR